MSKQCISLDPAQTALLVVDVQKRFCASGMWGANLPHAIGQFVKLHADQLSFFYTRTVGDLDRLPENIQRFRQLKGFRPEPPASDPASSLCDMFFPSRYAIIEKFSFDAFAGTALKQLLDDEKIRNVLIAGGMTDVCVDATARRAVMEGFDTFVLKDLVGAPDTHAESACRALEFFASYYGYVIESGQIAWTDSQST